MYCNKFHIALGICCVFIGSLAGVAQAQMVEFKYEGTKQYGKPIAWDSSTLLLLSRDGRAYHFPIGKISELTQLKNRFAAVSQSEMRALLLAEHGNRFQVSGTGHYLVVHPAGEGEKWSQRFEQIYRSVHAYVSTRGFRPSNPEFPLVAIVLSDRTEFETYSRRLNVEVAEGTVGYYHPLSNRIVVYDQTGADGTSRTWLDNADTIIHETAHQAAHNFALHSRFAQNPAWFVEGFATMFEAPGVWNPAQYRQRHDRINQYQLASFRKYILDTKRTGWLPELIGSDRSFQSEPFAAYSAAWALSFYLSESEAGNYFSYMKTLSHLPTATAYPSTARLNDFEEHFGTDLRMLESRVIQFVEKL